MSENATKEPLLTNRMYDVLKFITQILLPAAGTLYFTLATIWGLPNADQVVGTIVAADTFLGVLLGLSTSAYNKSDAKYDGGINITSVPDRDIKQIQLEFKDEPEVLESKKDVTFKVNVDGHE